MADDPRETLRRLEDRLDEASERAERLIAEARADQEREAQSEPHKPPPAGWETRGDDRGAGTPGAELDALINAIRSLRDLVPPEVRQRLAEAVREVLLAIRALVDWYIERLERRREEPPSVEDIPIQ